MPNIEKPSSLYQTKDRENFVQARQFKHSVSQKRTLNDQDFCNQEYTPNNTKDQQLFQDFSKYTNTFFKHVHPIDIISLIKCTIN